VNYDSLNGAYKMVLTNGEVLYWEIDTEGKEKLTITVDGKREKITKEMMQYYFPATFDVDKFLNDPPSKQRKTLEKLSGLDFTDIDKAYAEATENRAYYKKRVAEDEAIKVQWEPHWVNEIRTTEAVEKEIESVEQHNLNFQTIKYKLDGKKDVYKIKLDKIEELKKEIEKLEEECMQLETEIDKGTVWLNNPDKQPKSEEDKKALKEKLRDIEKNNDVVRDLQMYSKNKKYIEQYEAEVKQILSHKDEMIKLSDMPDGFGFDEEGVTYNGLPYNKKNQSSSALYMGALKLAARVIGSVKAIHFDASYLDKNSMQTILDWAESNNLQLLIERPDWNDGPITYELVESNNNTFQLNPYDDEPGQ
jgi:hypothetical protein